MPTPAPDHPFFVYRAQFKSELPLFADAPHKGLATFFMTVLREASRERITRSFRNWVVGNLETQQVDDESFLYGRIGRLQRDRVEHFAGDEFEELQLETSQSVAFVLHEASEITCVEDKSQLHAGDAIKRLSYIFNQAEKELRESKRLTMYPVEDQEEAVAKLKRLLKVNKFAAVLRQPNPYTSPQYRRWWSQVRGSTNAEKVNVAWTNTETTLGLDTDSPIRYAIEMSADAYGTWKATGLDANGQKRQVDSGDKAVRFRAPFRIPEQTIRAVANFLNSFRGRRGAPD